MPIFDQGYQHWKGTLSGHAWRWLAITKQGLRGQLKVRLIRLVLLVAWLPAIALVIAMAVWGLVEQGSDTILPLVRPILPPGVAADPHVYRHAIWTIAYSTFFKAEIFFIMLLLVIAGPNLISRDLRFNALPLYLSRPLTRLDYFIGKLGVIASLVAAVAVVPAVMAYVLGICFGLDLAMVRDTWRLLPATVAYGLVIVGSTGPLVLALSSLSRRSLYVGIAWGGLWLISSAVAGVLSGIHQDGIRREAYAQGGGDWNVRQSRNEQMLAEAAPTNWRPLCSYVANLERLGEALLNTDAAWVEMGRAIEQPRAALQPLSGRPAAPINERRLANMIAPQYPWIWSAGVLTALFGLSLWILSTRIKSLDRLK
jgi:ABC-2 type transport system permease protein